MKLPSKFALLALAALLAVGSAQAQERVMRENQVTEQSLIDALTPNKAAPAAVAPEAAASAVLGPDGQPVRTRSFRPGVRPAAAAAAGTAATSAQQARASILVTFVTDSADLTARAKSALDVLAGAMKSEKLATVKFTIEGHADPRGGEERNMKLSQLRAESVRAYLTSQHSLSAERINAVGKGSTALMNPSDPAAPENRRVTIVAQP
jgi:outer membrane protein OmpA-like peptidoglycan-associated protein